MKQFACYLSMLLVLVTGCRRLSEEDRQEAPDLQVLTAVLEGHPDTKTQLGGPVDGIYYPWWSKEDELAVYADGLPLADRFTLADGEGTGKAHFKGSLKGERLVALYPYSSRTEEGLKDDVLTLELPATQAYVPGSFGQGTYPMLAVSNTDALSFKNLCAVLKLSLTGEDMLHSIRFVAHDKKMAVSGKATVQTDFATEPELKMASGGSPEVTLDCAGIVLDPSKPTDFFLVIPAGKYKGGFDVEIKAFTGTVTRSISSDVTFARSQLRAVPAFKCVTDGTIDPDYLPYNQIWYKTSYDDVYDPYMEGIVSNVYKDGMGVITFAYPVTRIPFGAFQGNYLEEIHFPDCVETMDGQAVAHTAITSFKTPEKLSNCAEMAFFDNKDLTLFYGKWANAEGTAVVLEDGTMVACVVKPEGSVLRIPEGARILQNYLFDGRIPSGVTELVIPEGVETIGFGCFRYNGSLETVRLPRSLAKVSSMAFSHCPGLLRFDGDSGLIRGSCALVNPGDHALAAFAGAGVTDYEIPEDVTLLYPELFCDLDALATLTFTSSLDVYSGVILNCPNLTYFYGTGVTEDHHCLVVNGDYLVMATPNLPETYAVPEGTGITRIFASVFQSCTSVRHLKIPEGVREIGGHAFLNMSALEKLELPSTLVSVGWNAFEGCLALKELYLKSVIPPQYEEDHYASLAYPGITIYVPEGHEDQYKVAPGWSAYASYIKGYKYDDIGEVDYYISTDYSRDGIGHPLQHATEGNGIALVLLGDGFTDKQVADGTYEKVMIKMMEAFFGEEPYTSYRHLFDVSYVDVVSATEGYEHAGQALGGWFGEGTLVGGNDDKCMDYARQVVSDAKMDNTLVIVAMNSDAYAGTCWMYYPTEGDYGGGFSVAYFPIGTDDAQLARLVHHEAGGHGFPKLADEYNYEGTISSEEVTAAHEMEPYGWWKNVDFTADPSIVKWHHFLEDGRYAYDGLGLFEGAMTYAKGVWRPTDTSIMRYNVGGFNAPSREAIWYRIHRLAYGSGWTYDYEEFVAYDAVNRKTSASAPARRNYVERELPPTHAPVLVGRRWNEPEKKASTR